MGVQRYRGSCQCGRVAREADADLDGAISCNCSRCRRLGAVLVFAPRDRFVLLAGEGDLTEHRFNTRRIRHLFCRQCGIEGFAFGEMPDGSAMVALNVNCLDGVDARRLPTRAFDGASL